MERTHVKNSGVNEREFYVEGSTDTNDTYKISPKPENGKFCSSWKTIYSVQNKNQEYAVSVSERDVKRLKLKKSVSFHLYGQNEDSDISDLSDIKADISNVGNSKRMKKSKRATTHDKLLSPKAKTQAGDQKSGVVAGFFGEGAGGGGMLGELKEP